MKAFAAAKSRGRRDSYDEDLLVHNLDPFKADYLKILQSKAYRRLADKTQVLCFPENPHIRTRSVHTNEVIALSTTVSDLLGLNTSLCQAIAACHDVGHTPYGHRGEEILAALAEKPFRHDIFAVVICQAIERKGLGLNLTYETLDGMLEHSRGKGELRTDSGKPEEYAVVMYCDKIAYTFSDLNDAIRYGYLPEEPPFVRILGDSQRKRNDTCLRALIRESRDKGCVSFSEGKEFETFRTLRAFMYQNVYDRVDWTLHEMILRRIYQFFSEELEHINPVIATALLTDREANRMGEYFLATRRPRLDDIRHFGVFEIIPYLRDREIDYSDPHLEWESAAPSSF